MRKFKKPFLVLLLLYLIFDLRPLLLIPNLILYLKPCAQYTNGSGSLEMKVFPRLCVAGDPIRVVIRSHDLPLGEAFERSYDRSGIFYEFQFSGSINDVQPVETLYWTICMAGGLSSGEINPEKKMWLGDYVHFDRIGIYRINLRYQDSMFTSGAPLKPIDYDLGKFSIIYFPENPVSKLLKQIVLVGGLFPPFDKVREIAAKCLGYQQTMLSTYALAKYSHIYHQSEFFSSGDPHNNSLGEAIKGLLQNYNFRTTGLILRQSDQKRPNPVLAYYFSAHCYRLIYSDVSQEFLIPTHVAEGEIANLIDHTYVYLDESSKTNFSKQIAFSHKFESDEFWLQRIEKINHEITVVTNQTQITSAENQKKWATAHLAKKTERDRNLHLIDYTLALLEERDRKSGQ